jgi:hypothetical protein
LNLRRSTFQRRKPSNVTAVKLITLLGGKAFLGKGSD